jgi:hypothetical protein
MKQPIFRDLGNNVTYHANLGQYFLDWCGDELLLQATNDEEAIAEGAALLAELESK